ncbi:hypothetical protein ACSYGO_42250 [Streptomyces krungchingensis]
MSDHAVHATLTEDIAETVQNVPGVAFLEPGITGLLRSALSAAGPGAKGARPAGVRMDRPGRADPWHVEIELVARGDARSVDVARATRAAVQDRLASLFPAEPAPAHVTVTVTGLV